MGVVGLLSRKSCFNLLLNGSLHEFCFLIIPKESSLARNYYSVLYHSDTSSIAQDSLPLIPTRRSHSCKGRKLYSVVVRVCKSLSWQAVKQVPFKTTLKKYGFSHSMNAFTIMLHVFVFADMHSEAYDLLQDIVFNFQNARIDLRNLIHHLTLNNTSTFVIDVLIKVLSANKLFVHAIDAVNQAKKIGIEPSIYSCNFLLKCLAEASERENLLTVFEAMKDFGPSPNVTTYTIMMNFYCTNQHTVDDVKESYQILKEMWAKQISPSAATYGVWIRGLCIVGCSDVAWKFVRKLWYENQPVNSYCYNAIIHGFFSQGEVRKAVRVFEEMTSFGITADICSYSILIDGFCKFESIEGGLNFIQDMQANNIKPTAVSCSSILKGLCNIGAVEIANYCFHDLAKNYAVKFDQPAYNILITGFCAQGDLSSAHELLEEMISNNLAPNAPIYGRFIRASCHMGFVDTASKYLNRMVQEGFLPDTYTCNFIVKQYCTEGLVVEALRVVDEMVNQGITPNLYTYNVVINGLCKDKNAEKEGRVRKALHLIDEMVDQGIIPDLYTYNVVIHQLCKDKNTGKALELTTVMLKMNMFPNVVILNTLINGFVKQRNLRKANIFHRGMLKLEITPNITTYTILIDMLCKRRKVKKAYKLFRKMIREGLNPDTICYTSMIAGLCAKEDVNKAYALFHDMQQQGLLPGVVTYTCLIDRFCKLDQMGEAKKLLRQMIRQNISPDVKTYSCLIDKFCKLHRMDEAERLFDRMRKEDMSPDIITYKIMIIGYEMVGNCDLAHELMDEVHKVFKHQVSGMNFLITSDSSIVMGEELHSGVTTC